MPVFSKHFDYTEREKDYQLIADCIAGQRVVKKAKEKYLPKPNASDESPANIARYSAYVKRAVFHNVTARTVGNLVGQCFAVDPVPTVPENMQPWLDDLDGAGTSAVQQSKKALSYVVAFSRAFLWVDYPKTAGVVSQQQAEEEGIRPRVILVDPRKVINWRVEQQGAKSLLSLVVIEETYTAEDDGFETLKKIQYRVLRLKNGVYIQEVYRENQDPKTNGNFGVAETLTPQGGDGKPLKEIPGLFLGAESNGVEPEKPLMLDIANLNVAHYRNSADYEEAVYMLGQPTPWISGLSDQWVNQHMPNGVMIGSRSCIPLPVDSAAGLLQVEPNTLPKEAMDQKETLMKALGAKLVEKAEVAKTATESGINEASETSILASCCKNVTAAYGIALRWAASFGNVKVTKPEEEILFELNTDFAIARMTPEEATATLGLYQANLITFEEARDKLKTGGWAYLDDEEAKDQLDEQAEADFQKAQQELVAQTDEQIRIAQSKPAPGTKPPVS